MQPRDSHPRADGKSPRILGLFFNDSDNLVPRNDRRLARGQFTLDHMQIRPAYSASSYANQYFAVSGCGRHHIGESQRIRFDRRRRLQNACFHLTPMAFAQRIMDLCLSAAFLAFNF